ncbi:alpha/beta fold hydrolase [Rhizobium rhizoryzae]|uniref:Pimeloyl-ACP methyl ester carboxylesterase n=1 Tax=Rhizobium rhizoryzae TaxID=451876 RepID=A0A7W6LIL9_9HYPH|nr:alpha/beta hydrolase [Rhizobium rhizoryzae]MBB4143902.1 pimeloyl-ACP methyl ester carboxylesterase [Rhizobium rhizoryzae]
MGTLSCHLSCGTGRAGERYQAFREAGWQPYLIPIRGIPLSYIIIALIIVAALVAGLFGFTAWQAKVIEDTYPNIGTLTDVGGFKMNALHVPPGPNADLPPIVFVHGASGNLRDQEAAFLGPLKGRAELLFVDRPGHGYSERGGPENAYPDGQADAIARLMEAYGMRQAIIVGHSFGGAIVASFALNHPDKVIGSLFLAPATHPWPGGIDWHYRVTSTPVIGWLFSHTLVMPAGMTILDAATKSVFAPNRRRETYVTEGAPALVLRPANFQYNAQDVANLLDYVTRVSPRYPEIQTPAVIITGDDDPVVLANIHSVGLRRDIKNSELIWLKGVGHKPDYVATDLAIAAIEKLSGKPRDLQALAKEVDARVAQENATQ